MTKRVAIIGAAHRFPGTTPETFWQDLQAEKDLVTEVAADRWSHDAFLHPDKRHPGTSVTFAAGSLGDISGFDAEFFGISPREAANMDPQQRMLLELAWEAMENASILPSSLRGSQCGVFLGVASLDYSYRIADDMAAIDASTATGNTSSIASNRLSYVFDLHGPSMSLDTACSSSMVAFHQACQSIRSGETNMALAGGISLHLHPYGFIIFSKASMLSPTGRCQVFDEAGNGYVRSEGAGIFLLKDYDQAVADGDNIIAVVAGSAVNTDGHKSGLTVPNPSAQIDLMKRAYQQAGISPDEIDYLEAHGTGTAVGDPIETRAIGEALGQQRKTPLLIGSIKSNLGHLETASGVAGLAKALYSIQHREVPATIGIRKLNPRIKFDEWNISVVTKGQPLKKQGRLVIGVNSFGFGGANAHVILESPPERTKPEPQVPNSPLPIRLSARSEDALTQSAETLASYLRENDLRENDGTSFYDIAYTLFNHRDRHSHGALLFAQTAEEAAARLSEFAAGETKSVTTLERLPNALGPVFVYDGNGCQWETMGRDLISDSLVFAEAIDRVDALFQQHGNFSLRAELEGRNREQESDSNRFALTEIAQPALFALQVALTEWLRDQGIKPKAVLGHSVGEVAAAWASGALSLEDAVKVIYYRSDYQGKTRGQGEMTAVAMSADDIAEWLEKPEFNQVCLAGINSPKGITLAGDSQQLGALEAALSEQDIFAKRLPLDYAFHSPAMDSIEAGVIQALADITPRATQIPYYSTVTGALSDGLVLDATYWWKNIREPVLFDAAASALIEQGNNIFIEIGAHPILRRYLNESLRQLEQPGLVFGTIERHKPGLEGLQHSLSQMLLSGLAMGSRYFPVEGQRVPLPRYAWQRNHHWVHGTNDGQGLLSRYYQHPLLGYPLAQHEHTWESQLDTQRQPWLADHVVGEGAVFPGAGFVELTLAAALQLKDIPLLDIEELEIRAPLLLDGPHGRTMRLTYLPADGRLEIHSREPATGIEWQLNAVARTMRESRGFLLNRTAPALPKRAPDYTLADHLAMAERIGLHYGPAFQAISHGWIEGDAVIGEIALSDEVQGQLTTLHVHPGILDSAFQMFIPLLAQHSEFAAQLAFVPVRVGRIQVNTQAGAPVLARAVMGKRAPHSFTADFELYDAAGNAVAVLSKTRFKAIRLNRAHHQHFSYLDVELTPAPLQVEPLALPGDALARLADIASVYAASTGQRYGNEVAPLLDSLSEAFAQQNAVVKAQDQATDEAQHSPDVIWQLLVQDYPDYFAPIHLVGRLGFHQQALRSGTSDLEALGISHDQLARLNRVLVGESGWQALAGALAELIDALIAELPVGQRLQLLEAGPSAPALGERLLERSAQALYHDLTHYRVITTLDSTRHQAEQLQERFPLMDIQHLGQEDATALTAPAGVEKAQLAFVSVDITQPAATRQLIEVLPAQLAPGAQVMLIGIAPSRWLDDLLATPGIDQTALEQETLIGWLNDQGFVVSAPMALEESDSGAYLLHAHYPFDTPSAETADSAARRRHLVLADHSSEALAAKLVEALQQRGDSALLSVSQAAPAELLTQALLDSQTELPLNVIDLRGLGASSTEAQTARCEHALQWTLALEQQALTASLWLVTNGLSTLWQATPASGLSDGDAIGDTPGDAALWGFGRSLANEAVGHNVYLLDVPAEMSEPALSAWALLLAQPDGENEALIDNQGHRFATRLRTLPAPRPTQAEAAQTKRSHQAMTLGFAMPGQLRQLTWRPRPLPEAGADEVAIRVKATGLNFRDVMYTLGLLSDEAIENGFAGPTLGLEFSGVVESVGSNVTQLTPGQAVVGFGPASFSDKVIASQHAVAPLPEGISFAAAATIPTTFFTVYYALKHLARVEPGEKVLIHGAAGGVGIAALQIAQWLGADVYATVGSEEKRDFLRLMGIERLYDSRSLTFAEEILEDTNGEGVDVVLNSLAGEAINQNLRALRPFGRFLELGKRDFYENTHIGLRPFRNNLSYFGIDSDQLMKVQPALTQRLFGEMMALFNDGTLSPLPFTSFSHTQVIDAFRYMQQARQIGKVVVTYEQPIAPPQNEVLGTAMMQLSAEASYLVTGGLGGFGLRTAQWLVDKGARQLILLSRSGPASEEAQAAIAAFEQQGVTVLAAACDITDRAALADVLERAKGELAPLRGIVHAATVIDDGLIRNLDAERIQKVLAPKIDGARHLDALTRETELDFFVLYSSATTLFGNPGQANYVAANHWLEAFAANRRAAGLPATCVRWGAIEDVGFLARNTRTRDALQERLGGSALRSEDALKVLEQMLLTPGPSLGVLELEWGALARFLPTAEAPRFNEIARASDDDGNADADDDISALLADLSPEELHSTVTDLLRAELASILLVDEEKLDIHRSVYDMGFDSLMGVELMTAIENRLGVQVSVMVLSEASTLDKLAGVLIQKMHQHDDAEDAPQDAIASLAAQHGTEDLGTEGVTTEPTSASSSPATETP
ncbi:MULTISPECIES: type I polyketide synthase [unclassified Halomonas]|uniref:type I polyketide synthase n=1 Tax=unclassified Halomonas TaxID=2609666 RepID=UPI0007D9B426|nr:MULTISPECIES: type I polyketide synthase [unclassified Halomonas]MBT2787336.1 type I polyketide synthase [Halomonas sp. ISL-106]MBT2796302.1 type I polyketide synthase [Halomonas sp. ISL-104]OAL57549.1 polyketide synthase [Halomonas sp. ALS9]